MKRLAPSFSMALCCALCAAACGGPAEEARLGAARAPLTQGTACTETSQCDSNLFCVDGVCCNAACSDPCAACNLAGSVGSCKAVPKGDQPHGGRPACSNDSACSFCDGTSTGCEKATVGADCSRPDECSSGELIEWSCAADGNCASTPHSCAPYRCDAALLVCPTRCDENGDCQQGFYCEASACVAARANGAPCSSKEECASGFCPVDGLCCDSACTGSCESCAEEGSRGICRGISGASKQGHVPCASDSSRCGGQCQQGLCAYPAEGIECVAAHCERATSLYSAPSLCDGFGSCSGGGWHATCTFGCANAQECRSRDNACLVDADCGLQGTPCGGRCEEFKCLYPSSATQCGEGRCEIATGDYVPPPKCDGTGHCQDEPVVRCANGCADATQCAKAGNACTTDADCGAQGLPCSGACQGGSCTYPSGNRCGEGSCDVGSGRYHFPPKCDGAGQCGAGAEATCLRGCADARQCALDKATQACQSDADCGPAEATCSGLCVAQRCQYPAEEARCSEPLCHPDGARYTSAGHCDGEGLCLASALECDYGCTSAGCRESAACTRDADCPERAVCRDGNCKKQELKAAGGACSAAGGTSMPFGALALLGFALAHVAARRSQRRGALLTGMLTLGVASAAGFAPSAARAQAPNFEIQRFRPLGGVHDILGVESAQTAAHLQWGAGAFANYAYRPLVLFDDRTYPVVKHQLALDLMGAVGLGDWFELSAALPVSLYVGGDNSGVRTEEPKVDSFALSALRVTPKARLIEIENVTLGLSLPLGLPLQGGAYLKDPGLTANPRLLADIDGPVRISANAGLLFRERTEWLNLTVGNAFTYGVGAVLPLTEDEEGTGLDLLGTLNGEVGLSSATAYEDPLELIAALRSHLGYGFALTCGAGVGLVPGYGTPDLRLLAGLTYTSPVSRPPAPVEAPEPPVALPPEPPPEPEALRAVADRGEVAFGRSVTLRVLENDTSGAEGPLRVQSITQGSFGKAMLLDDGRVRYTPNECRVGLDEFQYLAVDSLGRRAIATVQINVQGGDKGCLAPKAKVVGKEIVILEPIFFATNKDRVLPKSLPVLRAVADVMKDMSEIRHLRIEGHTDSKGPDARNLELSKRRAKRVRQHLIEYGVEAERLSDEGYGESRPIAPNETEKGRAKNRRVNFIILN